MASPPFPWVIVRERDQLDPELAEFLLYIRLRTTLGHVTLDISPAITGMRAVGTSPRCLGVMGRRPLLDVVTSRSQVDDSGFT